MAMSMLSRSDQLSRSRSLSIIGLAIIIFGVLGVLLGPADILIPVAGFIVIGAALIFEAVKAAYRAEDNPAEAA